MSDMDKVKARYPDAREIPDVDSSRYAPQIWSDDKGYLGDNWADAASRLPREGGEPACSGCDGSSKWHSCNAEEFHNPPTEQRYESNLPPKDTNLPTHDGSEPPKILIAQMIEDLNSDKHSCGHKLKTSPACGCMCGRTYMIADGSVLIARNGRFSPPCTCSYGQRSNRTAEGRPANEPQGELSMVEIVRPTNDELWNRIQKFIESSPAWHEQDKALFAVKALRNQKTIEPQGSGFDALNQFEAQFIATKNRGMWAELLVSYHLAEKMIAEIAALRNQTAIEPQGSGLSEYQVAILRGINTLMTHDVTAAHNKLSEFLTENKERK